jgi:hypothetical protein
MMRCMTGLNSSTSWGNSSRRLSFSKCLQDGGVGAGVGGKGQVGEGSGALLARWAAPGRQARGTGPRTAGLAPCPAASASSSSAAGAAGEAAGGAGRVPLPPPLPRAAAARPQPPGGAIGAQQGGGPRGGGHPLAQRPEELDVVVGLLPRRLHLLHQAAEGRVVGGAHQLRRCMAAAAPQPSPLPFPPLTRPGAARRQPWGALGPPHTHTLGHIPIATRDISWHASPSLAWSPASRLLSCPESAQPERPTCSTRMTFWTFSPCSWSWMELRLAARSVQNSSSTSGPGCAPGTCAGRGGGRDRWAPDAGPSAASQGRAKLRHPGAPHAGAVSGAGVGGGAPSSPQVARRRPPTLSAASGLPLSTFLICLVQVVMEVSRMWICRGGGAAAMLDRGPERRRRLLAHGTPRCAWRDGQLLPGAALAEQPAATPGCLPPGTGPLRGSSGRQVAEERLRVCSATPGPTYAHRAAAAAAGPRQVCGSETIRPCPGSCRVCAPAHLVLVLQQLLAWPLGLSLGQREHRLALGLADGHVDCRDVGRAGRSSGEARVGEW